MYPSVQLRHVKKNHTFIHYANQLIMYATMFCGCVILTHKFLRFGGTDGTFVYNDIWSFNIDTRLWTPFKTIGFTPPPREDHAAAIIEDVIYVLGGFRPGGKQLMDLVAFKISHGRWYRILDSISTPRWHSCFAHAMVSIGTCLFIVGHGTSDKTTNSLPGELGYYYTHTLETS